MSISLEQLSAQMRRGEQVPLRHTLQVVLTLSIPSILQQIVVTAMEYIDAAMVGHIGASATASIGIVSSSTWLLHGMLAGLYMSFASASAASCPGGWARTRLCRQMPRPTLPSGPLPCPLPWPWAPTLPCCVPPVTR